MKHFIELEKAGEVGMTGPGGGKPRPIHKYIKREWDPANMRWNYTYEQEETGKPAVRVVMQKSPEEMKAEGETVEDKKERKLGQRDFEFKIGGLYKIEQDDKFVTVKIGKDEKGNLKLNYVHTGDRICQRRRMRQDV